MTCVCQEGTLGSVVFIGVEISPQRSRVSRFFDLGLCYLIFVEDDPPNCPQKTLKIMAVIILVRFSRCARSDLVQREKRETEGILGRVLGFGDSCSVGVNACGEIEINEICIFANATARAC